jgi:hypothetical protein
LTVFAFRRPVPRVVVPDVVAFAADAGAFAPLSCENVGVAGVGVAPRRYACSARVATVWFGCSLVQAAPRCGRIVNGPNSSNAKHRTGNRIKSSSACIRRAMTGTLFPPAEARITIARRSRIADPLPRRVIRSSC